ncbi:amidohydrolase [Yimella sp. cx-51]|uniref:amidohydrolase n=1 Tax=Yimella sp. cx-51 TaxID=2770551 RepID=UPI00165D6714|nr:amidohydrolase [Yimella sp. cx-51]MBC9958071.1 amidohydrolase [Yimella sp. cx-51]QTH38882.1 amidohydrolase [Yimella sp. cx-51]
MRIDLVLRHADLLDPVEGRRDDVDILIWRGRILDVLPGGTGPSADVEVDLRGRCVTAGFIDAHNHMAWYGLSLAEIDLSGARSVSEVAALVSGRASQLDAEQVVIGAGYDHNDIGGHPDRHILEEAVPGRQVWLKHRSGHMGVASSALLQRIGVFDGVAAPEGGRIVLGEDGTPTGLLQEQAQNLVSAHLTPVPLAVLSDALVAAGERYAAEGLVHVTECGMGAGWLGQSPVELAAYQRAGRALRVRCQLMPAVHALHSLSADPSDDMTLGLDLGIATGFGDDRLRLGAVKIWLDGSLIGRTAAMTQDYCGCSDNRGFLQDDPEVMRTQISAAHAAGWNVAAHAIGDAAMDFALEVFEQAQAAHPRPQARHRIEHAALTSPEQVARMAALGLSAVPQMRFLYEMGDAFLETLGEHRMPWLYRHRSLLDAGCRVVGSSDRPVSNGAPLLGMASMVERRTASGRVLSPDERVDAMTALRAYTVHAAWMAGEEAELGRVATGLRADLVILDRDISRADGELLAHTKVLATLSDGLATYDSCLGLPQW